MSRRSAITWRQPPPPAPGREPRGARRRAGRAYLAVDAKGRPRWRGKAHRGSDISARLEDHFRHPERARAYAGVFDVEADPFSPAKAIEAAEGRAADLIGLRSRMGPRTWPVVTEAQWLAQVTSHPATRVGRPRPSAGGSDDRSAAPA